MKQFNLEEWLQDKSRKVTTRLGNREVRIICWDRKNNDNRPIITLMIDPNGNEYTTFHTKNGFVDEKEKYIDKRDLFFADEKPETIEIPFGAKDSEFISGAYTIPKGCKARIEGDKVIIEKIQKQEELTEFEKEVKDLMNSCCNEIEEADITNELAKEAASNLLDLARKELQPEFEAELDKAYKTADNVQYQKGKQDALKDLPKWKKASGYKEFDKHVILLERDNRVCLTEYVNDEEYYIVLDDLKTLPKEEL